MIGILGALDQRLVKLFKVQLIHCFIPIASKQFFLINYSIHMTVKYTCTHWGSEQLDAAAFMDKIKMNGYAGVEINLPDEGDFLNEFLEELDDSFAQDPNFIFIPQQLIFPENESLENFISRMAKKFSFHAATLVPYVEKFPELELVGDFSHFCVVSESLLQNQQEILNKIKPHVSHIHARIGYSQGPQVNDPFAPEWANHMQIFDGWWNEIINLKKDAGWQEFNITPEFGPDPYMPAMPFTLQPLGNQWEINVKMKAHLTNLFNK